MNTMALILCSECGTEVSDKAATCPKCGVPINAAYEIPVYFEREKRFTASACRGDISIDGAYLGILLNGGTLSTHLLPGHHQVIAEAVPAIGGGGRKSVFNLEVPNEANEIHVKCRMKNGFFGLTLALENIVVK